jgi:hypothetical protein
MVFVTQNEVGHLCNGTSLVKSAVHIVNGDWPRQSLGPQPISLDIVSVYEPPGRSRVHQGVKGFDFPGVSGFNVYLELEGAGGDGLIRCSYNKSGWEVSLPFWARRSKLDVTNGILHDLNFLNRFIYFNNFIYG